MSFVVKLLVFAFLIFNLWQFRQFWQSLLIRVHPRSSAVSFWFWFWFWFSNFRFWQYWQFWQSLPITRSPDLAIAFSAPAPRSDTPASYAASTQSDRISSRHACASESCGSHVQIRFLPSGTCLLIAPMGPGGTHGSSWLSFLNSTITGAVCIQRWAIAHRQASSRACSCPRRR